MANVRTETMTFPFPMGKFLPGATFATASLPFTQNTQPTKHDGQSGNDVPDNQFNRIVIQAAPGNGTGIIYICSTSGGADTTAYTNIIQALSAGQIFDRGKEWANNRDISKIFIGAGDSASFAFGYIDQF